MIVPRSLAGSAILLLFALPVGAADAPKKEPDQVSYYRDIRPIFQQHCQGCHQPARPQGGYIMTGHGELFKEGDSEKHGVVAGKPDESEVVRLITPNEGKAKMPRGKPPLSEYDRKVIAKWITQGAKDDTPISARDLVDAAHPPVYTSPPVVGALDYSPDGTLLAVAGFHEVLLHKADGSGLVARLVGLSERITSVAFSPDGEWLAVTGGCPGRFGEVQVWNVGRKKLRMSVPVTFDTIYGASWSPDSKIIAFGCADNTLRAIDMDAEQVLYQGAHSDWVLGTAFSVKGTHVVSVSRDRTLKLTELATQRFIDNITSITPGALKGGLLTVARHPKEEQLLIGGSDGVPKIYKMFRDKKRVIGDDFNFIRAFDQMPGRIFCVRFDKEGTRFVAGSSLDGKGEVRVYKVAAALPRPEVISLCGIPTLAGPQLAPLFFLGDYRTSSRVSTLQGQEGAVYAVAYRPDGRQVASAGFDGKVRLNDPDTGKLITEFVAVPITTGTAEGK